MILFLNFRFKIVLALVKIKNVFKVKGFSKILFFQAVKLQKRFVLLNATTSNRIAGSTFQKCRRDAVDAELSSSEEEFLPSVVSTDP